VTGGTGTPLLDRTPSLRAWSAKIEVKSVSSIRRPAYAPRPVAVILGASGLTQHGVPEAGSTQTLGLAASFAIR